VTLIDKKKEDAYKKVMCDIDLTVVALSLKSESNNKRLLTKCQYRKSFYSILSESLNNDSKNEWSLKNDSVLTVTHFLSDHSIFDVLRHIFLVIIFYCTVRNDANNKTFVFHLTLLGIRYY
jgi:hypothetical protein